MIGFLRNICEKEIVIYVEEELYKKNRIFFDAVLRTFFVISKNLSALKSDKAIYIFSQNEKQEEVFTKKVYCNTTSPQWKYWLIYELENIYASELDCLVLHASGLRWNKKNIIIIGESMSGKSTLTYEMCANRDACFLDDDSVYLYNNSVFGFTMPMALRIAVNIEGNRVWDIIGYTDDAVMRNRKLIRFDKIVEKMEKIDMIIFPHYNANSTGKCTEIKGAELINNVLLSIRACHDINSLFVDMPKILSNVKAYGIEYNSSNMAINILQDVVCNERE